MSTRSIRTSYSGPIISNTGLYIGGQRPWDTPDQTFRYFRKTMNNPWPFNKKKPVDLTFEGEIASPFSTA